MSLTRWLRGKVDGEIEVLLQDFAVQEVRRAAPEAVERLAAEAVRESLGVSSVTREDFDEFADETKRYLDLAVSNLRAEVRVVSPSSGGGYEPFVESP
jgi:hypothetical protein